MESWEVDPEGHPVLRVMVITQLPLGSELRFSMPLLPFSLLNDRFHVARGMAALAPSPGHCPRLSAHKSFSLFLHTAFVVGFSLECCPDLYHSPAWDLSLESCFSDCRAGPGSLESIVETLIAGAHPQSFRFSLLHSLAQQRAVVPQSIFCRPGL